MGQMVKIGKPNSAGCATGRPHWQELSGESSKLVVLGAVTALSAGCAPGGLDWEGIGGWASRQVNLRIPKAFTGKQDAPRGRRVSLLQDVEVRGLCATHVHWLCSSEADWESIGGAGFQAGYS